MLLALAACSESPESASDGPAAWRDLAASDVIASDASRDAGAADSTSSPLDSTPTGDASSLANLVNECASPAPEWIWCDDFEQDRTASYFEGSLSPVAGAGVAGSYGTVNTYPANVGSPSGGGGLKVAFGRTPSSYFKPVDDGTRDYREIYWRMYLRHPADWQGGGADKLSRATVFASSDWAQAMLAHVWSGGDPGADANYLMLDPASGTNTSGALQTTKYNDFANLRWLGARRSITPVFDAAHLGKWHCIEAHVRLNDPGAQNGVFELWIDGTAEAGRTDLNWVGSYDAYGINAVLFENYWNDGSPVEQARNFDNLVVSTARIGCGG